MNDFLKFFNEIVKTYPLLHLEIGYNKVADWGIHIYERNFDIVDVSDCDMELCFAKAQVQLKEWLLKYKGGY